ncbi:hypothetical protein MVEN_02331400 [Mycena venus]|uniref:Uncharacterized protein n=1 Tax=Mycena venus TaxID=2733690 RepID=A0A8H7CFP2_9AGAR|nr:hypothetical protein MVEN_02331400 [Mycena venus]
MTSRPQVRTKIRANYSPAFRRKSTGRVNDLHRSSSLVLFITDKYSARHQLVRLAFLHFHDYPPTTPLPMWLLSLLFGLGFVSSAQVNHTIDDASPLVTYRAVIDRSLTGFNRSQLNNGTVTFIPATEHDSPTISMNFTGTAIYVFVAYPAGHNESFVSGFSARIDGVPYGGWAVAQTAPPGEPSGVQPEWELYFDYAVYTSGDPDPLPSSNSAPPTTTSESSVSASNTGIPVPIATGNVAGEPSLTPSVSVSTVKVPGPTFPGGVAGVTFTGNTPVPTGSDNIPVQASAANHKQMPVAAIVGGVLGALILLALVATPLILRRRAQARRAKARRTLSPFIIGNTGGDGHTDEERDVNPRDPPLAPVVLHPPPPAHTANMRQKSPLRVTIPTWTATPEAPARTSGTEAPQTSLSAASDVTLAQIAEQVRRMRMSMLRLETGMPEARDGGPALIRPPAYGSGNYQSQVYNVNEKGHANPE